MNKHIGAALLGVLAVCLVTTAQASDPWAPGATGLSLEAGLTAGGDKLVTITDTNGDTKSLYAGNSLFTDVGVQHNFGDSGWSLRATGGFAADAQSYSNANVSFAYVPVNVLGIYSVGNNHFGAGLAVHLSPKLDLDGLGPNADFKTATGLVLQYQYWLFGVRYTAIRYQISSVNNVPGCFGKCDYDGSSIGVFFNYVF
ncbi:MAG TPA: hypothetical protein VGM16_04320 [Gammaproteobacteria bacterium]|jgi:hypothetical protein